MKTALVYDWLITRGGGERVVENLLDLYPSPLFTLVCDRKQFATWDIRTSFLQNLPKATSWYRHFLPLFPFAIEQFDVRNFDLVLSVSHAAAKGVLTHAEQLHLCYCFTPMRYAWDLTHCYLSSLGKLKRPLARFFLHKLRQWDASNSVRVDHFIAISHYIARRIEKNYRRQADVIYPPVATHLFSPAKQKDNFYLTVSRFVPYKRIDLIVEAFSYLPHQKLIVIGDGPEKKVIEKKARANVELLGWQSDEVVRDYMSRAKAFIFAAEEDFGIVPVEAQAAGTPVIAYGKGGALETILEQKTGLFFKEQSLTSLISAIEQFEKIRDIFDPYMIKDHAEQFSEERFKREFKQLAQKKIELFQASRAF